MTIGERLREERERLGLSQPKFAAIAGTTKQTLFSWETGKTAPDGFQLAALGTEQVDVLYVLTGQRTGGVKPAPTLTADEEELLALFRAAPLAVKAAAIGALHGAAAAPGAPKPRAKAQPRSTKNLGGSGSSVSQTFHGTVQGGVAGGNIVHQVVDKGGSGK